MTDKELRRMSRAELLELLIEQMEENERLRMQLSKANAELANRRITIDRAGSIAKASLELNKVFEAADQAARQYVESVRRMADDMVAGNATAHKNAAYTKTVGNAAGNTKARNADERIREHGERKAKRT